MNPSKRVARIKSGSDGVMSKMPSSSPMRGGMGGGMGMAKMGMMGKKKMMGGMKKKMKGCK